MTVSATIIACVTRAVCSDIIMNLESTALTEITRDPEDNIT